MLLPTSLSSFRVLILTWRCSQVYGEATALLSVGYEYVTCSSIVWETLTATLHGFHMDISDVGGWNLDIHHMYNFEAGK